MAKKRVGVWMRLWIVLTILWTLGAGMTMFVYVLNEHETRQTANRELCEFMKADGLSNLRSDCWQQYAQDRERYSPATWENFFIAIGGAAAIAAFFWIIGLIGYFTVRWILAGRIIPEPSPLADDEEARR